MCDEITNLVNNNSRVFSAVNINNKKAATDVLANPISLSQLPTTISITFGKVCRNIHYYSNNKLYFSLIANHYSKYIDS